MKCPFCAHSNTQVLDTRMSEEGDTVRRRRRCESCDRRFTTYERIELFFPAIVKKNGSRADYTRDKLKDSMRLALRKRPVSAEAIDASITRIEEKLLALGEKEIPSSQVGELVMRELRRLDKIAYIRFASVYRSFEDVSEFRDVLDEFSATGAPKK
ncbi:NrdR family transcriptional regulator [Burkholderiaceae bacterium 16]|nr:NrdR family transcriptional regulator [Burkholderiaceae bacterium 16]